jgi:hypothetical protein
MELLLKVGNANGILRVCQSEGNDDGRWLGFSYTTLNVARTWSLIQQKVLGHALLGSSLTKATIVVCQGEAGWDDYLLLHHFNPNEPLDSMLVCSR